VQTAVATTASFALLLGAIGGGSPEPDETLGSSSSSSRGRSRMMSALLVEAMA
jgi:hypothetical protein